MYELNERTLIERQLLQVGTGLFRSLMKEVNCVGVVEGAEAVEHLTLEVKASLARDQETSIVCEVQPSPNGCAGHVCNLLEIVENQQHVWTPCECLANPFDQGFSGHLWRGLKGHGGGHPMGDAFAGLNRAQLAPPQLLSRKVPVQHFSCEV
jgi:hypothetical protein